MGAQVHEGQGAGVGDRSCLKREIGERPLLPARMFRAAPRRDDLKNLFLWCSEHPIVATLALVVAVISGWVYRPWDIETFIRDQQIGNGKDYFLAQRSGSEPYRWDRVAIVYGFFGDGDYDACTDLAQGYKQKHPKVEVRCEPAN
jgi:hypothetical protein